MPDLLANILHFKSSRKAIVAISIVIALSGCGNFEHRGKTDSAPPYPVDVSKVPNAVPRVEPFSRYGNPKHYRVGRKNYYVLESNKGYRERGIASWYGTKFHGRRTSSGEPYDMFAMTAAHKTLPLPTYASVTNIRNGKSVIVKINDRGPFKHNRLIDLSYAAAAKLGITDTGTGLVEITAIDAEKYRNTLNRPIIKKKMHDSDSLDANIYLQVGAFSERNNAEKLLWRLRKKALKNSKIVATHTDNKPVYRVQIGPMKNAKHADQIAAKLAKLGIKDSHVVIN
ncbi:MAG: septal ring lytic transglycosylase RlpA family protein [Gammaproteobacteria bacterium]